MQISKILLFICVLTGLFCCTKSGYDYYILVEDDLEEFVSLGGSANFNSFNGILTGTTKLNTPNTFLATKKRYGDFVLEFEVKIEIGMNSGVQIRSNYDEENNRVYGYQVEIETSDRKWAGGIYEEARRGWLYPLKDNTKARNAFRNNEWNAYRVEAIQDTIKTWVNGIQCAHLIDTVSHEGFIAFQVHSIGSKDQEGKNVQWKNVKITENKITDRMWSNDSTVKTIDLSAPK